MTNSMHHVRLKQNDGGNPLAFFLDGKEVGQNCVANGTPKPRMMTIFLGGEICAVIN